MSVSFSVEGKTVVITGGRGGIGRAIAEAFAGAGARVIATDVSPVGSSASGIEDRVLDVTDRAAVAAFAEEFSSLDCLVQCAGRAAPMAEYDQDTFEEIVGVHLFGTFSLASALKPALAQAKGSVVNIGSMYSFFGSPMVPAYGAAKAATVQLTKTLAVAWAGDGIRVNAVAPGWIKTPMTAALDSLPDAKAAIVSRLPTGELGEPQDIAGAVVFLASPASSLITGVTIPVDGGYSAM